MVGPWLLDITTGPSVEGENCFINYWMSVGKAIFLPLVTDNFPFFQPKKGNSLELPFKVTDSFVKPCERVLGSVIPLIWCCFWGQWSSYWPSGQGVEIPQLTQQSLPEKSLSLAHYSGMFTELTQSKLVWLAFVLSRFRWVELISPTGGHCRLAQWCDYCLGKPLRCASAGQKAPSWLKLNSSGRRTRDRCSGRF